MPLLTTQRAVFRPRCTDEPSEITGADQNFVIPGWSATLKLPPAGAGTGNFQPVLL